MPRRTMRLGFKKYGSKNWIDLVPSGPACLRFELPKHPMAEARVITAWVSDLMIRCVQELQPEQLASSFDPNHVASCVPFGYI